MRARIIEGENRKWWTLGAVAFALFMIMLDNTVVNVALPSIERSFDAAISELEWVVNAYALTFAVLMLSGGKLADLFGRRRIFLLGLIVFSGASLACGLSSTIGQLIAFRAFQGVGAALMMPATLAIISATFPPRQRGLAFGIWAGVSAMALAIGPLVGGILTQHIDWSWIFFVNVPVGILGVLVGAVVITESRDTTTQSLDLPGLVVSGAALFALTFGLIEANSYGWTSPTILGLFAGAAVGLALFIWIELRRRAPMLDLSLFRSRTFTGANIVAFLVTLAMFGVFFFMSLYVQQILGYSPVQAGAIFLPMTILIILVAPIAGKLSDKIGSRWLMAGGLTLVAGSLAIFSRLGVDSGFWDMLPGLLVGGIGMALTMTPMTAAAMGSVPRHQGGYRLGRAEYLPPGRRLTRDRRHGCDPDLAADERPRLWCQPTGGVHRRVQRCAGRRSDHRLPRRCDRGHPDQEAGDGAHRPATAGRGVQVGRRGSQLSATRPRKPSVRPRLTAAERRASLVDTACRVFSEGSYRGTTTAEIARAAGVTEPILYRHFSSKRDLYLACLSEAWDRVRTIWDAAVARESDPALWHPSMVRALRSSEDHSIISHLWVQALVEASEDPEIARVHALAHARGTRLCRGRHATLAGCRRGAPRPGSERRGLDLTRHRSSPDGRPSTRRTRRGSRACA